jgi:hypothetical protein
MIAAAATPPMMAALRPRRASASVAEPKVATAMIAAAATAKIAFFILSLPARVGHFISR